MPCTEPKLMYKYGHTKNGKQKLVSKRPMYAPQNTETQLIPCGKCISCKLSHSKDWALRIQHEAQTSQKSAFLTLTYNNENLPANKSVDKREVQLFLKKLRKRIQIEIRFFACGEYGDTKTTNHRPHYHIIILGYDFPDKKFYKTSSSGSKLYRSQLLETLWTKGFSDIGEVTFQSAAYVARYTLKKTKDKSAYQHIDTQTGEYSQLLPQFILMSKGIGKTWWKKYNTDTDKDFLTNQKHYKAKVPRYYDKLRDKQNPESLKHIKENRKTKAIEYNKTRTKIILKQQATVKKVQSTMLKRSLDHENP